MIILSDAKMTFDRIQLLFLLKISGRSEMVETYFSIVKATPDKPIATIILNGEKLNDYP